jgi:hypothetical protein
VLCFGSRTPEAPKPGVDPGHSSSRKRGSLIVTLQCFGVWRIGNLCVCVYICNSRSSESHSGSRPSVAEGVWTVDLGGSGGSPIRRSKSLAIVAVEVVEARSFEAI